MDLGDATHIMFEKQIKKLSIADKEKLLGLKTLADVEGV
jgi:hypothetical protein